VWVSFGIFQSSYSTNPLFKSSTGITTIGTLLNGIAWLATPLTNALVLRYSDHRMHMLWFGWLLCITGLVGASFATQVWHLQVFQGFFYGAGWVIYWSPMLVTMNEWWIERRGMAFGLWFTASNVSGFIMPFLVQWLLDRHDFRVTLRVYTVLSVLVGGTGMVMLWNIVKGKSTTATPGKRQKKRPQILVPKQVLKDKHFYIFAAAVFSQAFVYIVPTLFLPSFANSLRLPTGAGSYLLVLASVASICGQMMFGHFSDRVHPYILTSISSFVSGVAALILPGADSFFWLSAFALAWGFSAASYDVFFARICSVLTTDAEDSLTLYGFLSFERGVAVLLEGPIGAALLRSTGDGLARYHPLLELVGLCMIASSLCGLGGYVQTYREVTSAW